MNLLDPSAPGRYGTDEIMKAARLADALDVEILIEPHGEPTDSIDGMGELLEELGHPGTVGVNLDTGNAWLGGADPVGFAETFRDRIRHVHWKDLDEEWEAKRGEVYGCGMSPTALGEGAIDVAGLAEVLRDAPDLKYATLEIAGDENLRASREFLRERGAE